MTTPLPDSGTITMAQIRANMEISTSETVSLGDPRLRALVNKKTGPISMGDFYGSNELELNVTAGEQDPPGVTAGFYDSFWGSLSQPNINGIRVVGVYDSILENKFVLSLEGSQPRSAFRSVWINGVIFYESDVTTHDFSVGDNATDWTWEGQIAGLVPGQTYEFSYCTGPATQAPNPDPVIPPDPDPPEEDPVDPPSPTAVATPTVESGQTLELLSGQTYYGTLDLYGKNNITVSATGQNGPAVITLGITIPNGNWSVWSGNIYQAQLPGGMSAEKVLSMNGQILPLVHTGPTDASPFTSGVGSSGSQITWPGGAIANSIGGQFVFLSNQSVCSFPYNITGQSGNTLTVASSLPDNSGLQGSMQGYLQGKRWMFANNSEAAWCVENGIIYLRAPGGVAPNNVVIASAGIAIDAMNSTNVTLRNVSVRDAGYGIRSRDSTNFRMNTSSGNASTIRCILNDGISCSGAAGSDIRHVTGRWMGNSGLHAWYMRDSRLENIHLQDVGNWGPTRASYGGLYASEQVNMTVVGCSVVRCGYHGIAMMFPDPNRTNNGSIIDTCVVEQACLKLFDGGAIYTISRWGVPLHLTIRNCATRYSNLHHETVGLYIDDRGNNCIVEDCTTLDCSISLLIHDGFTNIIRRNVFDSAGVHHIGLSQSLGEGNIRNNSIRNNIFRVRNGENCYNCETGNDNNQFCAPDYNEYLYYDGHTSAQFARTWTGSGSGVDRSFSNWRTFIQAGNTGAWDANSIVNIGT